jgi:hypothetical protein
MTDIAQVRELLAQGLSRPAIAQRLSISYHAVRVACDKLGIARRGNGGRPCRDGSHALVNLLDRIRDHAGKLGLFFRTSKGRYLFYDGRSVAQFTDAKAAWSWLRDPTRRGASKQLHWLQSESAVVTIDAIVQIPDPPAPATVPKLIRTPRLNGSLSPVVLR